MMALHLLDVRFPSKGLGLKNSDLYFSHHEAGVKSGGGRTITAPPEQDFGRAQDQRYFQESGVTLRITESQDGLV